MTEINQNYKCSICGNVVKIVQAGQGALVCCGQPMELMTEMAANQPTMETVPPIPETETQEVPPTTEPEASEPPMPEEKPVV